MRSRRTGGTGIDLGHRAVKLVRIEEDEAGPRVTHWGIEEIHPADLGTPAGRRAALGRLLSRLALTPRRMGRVAAAVGGRDVYVRQVTMPALSPDDLRRALPYEAKKHLPLKNVPDPILECQVLVGVASPETEIQGQTQEVLLVAVPRGVRDEALAILDGESIDPHLVDAQPLPALNAVLAAYPRDPGDEGTVILADLGEESSVLAAVLPEGGLYVRSLAFTGKSLTDRIQAELSCDRGGAQGQLRELAEGKGGGIQALLEELLVECVREVADTIRHLSVRQRVKQVGRFYVCGGAALFPGLADRLHSTLGIDVAYPDPLQGLVLPADDHPAWQDRARLATSVGLARWWEPGEV